MLCRRTLICPEETEGRIKFLEQARSSLHVSFEALQMQEAKHQFVLSSFRNIATMNGDAAYSAAYMVGQIYMVDYQGLEKTVWNQFEKTSVAYAIRPMR